VAEPADVAPAGLGTGDIGARRSDGVARAIARIAPETATADNPQLLPDLAVLTGPAAPAEVEALMRDRVTHLAVRADEAIGVVGPLVEPGRSACLRCINLHKAARDPAWPKVLAQAGAGTGAVPAACDTVLAAATAALASAQALAVIDGCGPQPPAAANGTLELFLPEWQWRRRTWVPVATCTCGARTITRAGWPK
jgi:hypothetical protein